jgi:hypothetical protein
MEASSEGTVGETSSLMSDEGENIYLEYLAQKVPAFIKTVPVQRLESFIKQKPAVPEWYGRARVIDRQYLKALIDERWRLQGPLEKTLKDVQQDIKAFAQPLLVQALKGQLNLELDVNTTVLRIYAPATLTFGIDTHASRVRQYTLLEAALHNFEEPETQAGAFRDGSGVFTQDAEGALQRQTLTVERFTSLCRTLDIGAQYQKHITALLKPDSVDARTTLERHAVACEIAAFNESALIAYLKNDLSYYSYSKLQDVRDRKSNIMLGSRPLQCHRLSLMGFKLTGVVVFSAVADSSLVKKTYDSLIPAHQQLLMEWSQRLSILPGQEFEQFKLLKAFFANGPGGVLDEMLRQDDIHQQSRLDGPLIAYVPDDPEHPLKEYASLADFMKALISQLRAPDYQQFFSRFVAQKDKGRFFSRINERLSTFTWHQREPLDMGPWWRETATENPDAEPITNPVTGDIWRDVSGWRREKAIADARHIAVPTGDEDAATRWARLTSYLSLGWNVFNFGALLVPGLGEAMLGIMAGQMLLETMEGIEDWSKGDRDEAAGLLVGVMINAAQLALMMAGHVLPGGLPMPVKASSFVDQLKKVELADGSTRLWNPDLKPYEHAVSLPKDAVANERGLHRHNGRDFLPREGKHFEVTDDPQTGQPRLQHPNRSTAYQPKMKHNGAGAWQTELDRPIEWDKTALMRRLGPMVDGFDDATLEQIRIASGVEENALRRLQVENDAPPALLVDTIRRFQAWAETEKQQGPLTYLQRKTRFDALYNAHQLSDDAGVRVIQDAFSHCPANLAEELLAAAAPEDLRVVAQNKRLPLSLKAQLRSALLEVRTTRAYEGLFLEFLHTADTDRLALHTLETLPNWPGDVRIEIREHSLTGPLRDSIGSQDASVRKVLVSSDGDYQARDAADQHLHGADNLFASVLHALPDTQRIALGYEINQADALRQAVQRAPLARDKLLPMLADNPIRKPIYDPQTMKLRGGMPGDAQGIQRLTARLTPQERVRSVRPGWTETEAQAYLAGGGREGSPEQRASELEAQFNRLTANFQRWLSSPTEASRYSAAGRAEWQSRNALFKAIRQCWQHTGPKDVDVFGNAHGITLDLSGMPLGRHLATMPPLEGDFGHVTHLNLLNTGLADAQVSLLDHFPRLRHLNLNENPLTRFPRVVGRMHGLTELNLRGNRIALDEHAVVDLGGLVQLESLDLMGNPLGRVPDIGRMPMLHTLLLTDTGISTWPDGLFSLPRFRHFYLDIQYNRILEVPSVARGSADAELLARTVLSRNARWLPEANLQTLREYIQSVGMDPDRPYPPRGIRDSLDWEQGLTRPEWVARQEVWNEVEDEHGSVPFFNEIRKLTESYHFKHDIAFRVDMTAKVWRMLDAMSKDTPLREKLFTMSSAPTQCVDGGAQLFNAMGVEVLIHEAYELASPNLVEAELVQLAQGKSRLDELSKIAHKVIGERASQGEQFRRVNAAGQVTGTIDEVEVHLAYMTDLADRLELPWQSRKMQFRTIAAVTPQMIEAACQRVLDLEAGELLRDSISEQPFWVSYIQGSNRRAFKAIRRRIDATTDFYMALEKRATQSLSLPEKAQLKEEIRVLAAELGLPESEFAPGRVMSAEEYESEMSRLNAQTQTLLKTLTRQAMDRAKLQRVETPLTLKN